MNTAIASNIENQSPIILVERVTKSYTRGGERILVLDELSIEIKGGSFIALMGPSGSGKTTLLNLIAGIDRPDSGRILVGDSNISALSESQLTSWRARSVGFIFQFYNLFPVLTALENVALPLSLLPMKSSERKERAAFALEVVGLGDRVDHYPRQLSGGQEQRVAIARAIVTDPAMIVADEPTGDLDRTSATEVLSLLQRLNKEYGKTIIMVTHDLVAAEFAGHIVQLDKGKLITK